MRIGIAQLWQETNTLNPQPTTRADFEQSGILRGAAVIRELADVNEPGGFLTGLTRWQRATEPVGIVRLPAWPGGPLTADAMRWVESEVVAQLEAAKPLDAVLFALHGAMAAENTPDVEGRILERVRELIGPLPLVATLDLHANLTAAMVHAADTLAVYHCAPHVDVFDTGLRAAEILRRIVEDNARPVSAFQKIPAVAPPELANTEAASGPAADFKRQLKALEEEPRILSAALLPVQPWLNIPELGSAVLVVSDGAPDLAREACSELAQTFWNRRREYLPELIPYKDAVQRAQQVDGLAVLSDAADATTSGAPGDSVWILEELLKHDWPRSALVTLVAPQVVSQAAELGVGQRATFSLGGVRDTRFGRALVCEAEVERLFDARFTLSGHIGKNMPIDMGTSAVLRSGSVRIVVTSRSGPHFAPELFHAAGLDPFAAHVLVAKSPCGFRAVYTQHAAWIANLQSPGCAPSDFWQYEREFSQIPRPTWPWDPLDDWQPDPIVSTAPCRAS